MFVHPKLGLGCNQSNIEEEAVVSGKDVAVGTGSYILNLKQAYPKCNSLAWAEIKCSYQGVKRQFKRFCEYQIEKNCSKKSFEKFIQNFREYPRTHD